MFRLVKVFIITYIVFLAFIAVVIGINPLQYAFWNFIIPVAGMAAVNSILWCWIRKVNKNPDI